MNKERALLLTLAVIQFSHITDFMILMPLGPTLMRAFDILPSQFALLVSAYTFSAGIFGFVGAFFIDRFDRKKMLIIMATGFALGTLACGFSSSYYLLLFTRAFTGSFGGILSALILSIIGDAVPNERRAGAMGLVMASFSLASVVGVPLGLYLATLSDWHFPFISLGVIALLTLIPIAKFIPTMNTHIVSRADRESPIAIVRNVLENKNQLYALLFGVIIMFSHFSVVPFISPYLVTNVGFSEKDITYIYLIGGGLTIFTAPLIGRLADRFGRLKIFVIAVIIVSFPIFFLTNLTEQPIWIVLLITSFFFVFGSGRMIPSTAMITSSVRPKNRGSFMSFNSACRQLTNGFAAYFGGLIITQGEDGLLHHYDWVGYIAIAMGILSIIIARKIKVVDESGFEN
ncbi:MFS transporter [Acidiluteibacter ferrifornacis]|uniref:MFS transporter n=1 Tax=Acidiluteibacter ferrifornacis TaxID=2692424 RepID=A0A6N9NKN4_9FLAO|nr:MFS transporter [Acidiluteibacter ferrifornacis]MBR9831524.1 MFS transporter [bacterium]NBG67266.1 MFS transporter [Acidiluteibacter ferrifornacis]